MERCGTIFVLLALAFAGLGVGCANADTELLPGNQADAEQLRELGRSLVPDGSRILLEEEGACEMFRDFPDCLTVSFYDPAGRDHDMLVEAVEQKAKLHGWSVTDAPERLEGGTWLEFSQGGYEAWVSIREHETHWLEYCEPLAPSDPDFVDDCADHLQVQS